MQIWFTTHIKWVRYFAAQGNMGDVAAKDESQTSIAQLVGYAAGIGLLSVSHAPAYLYALYTLLTPAHLMMTALMMRVATFEVLTMPRLGLLARAYAGEDGAAGVRSLREIERADETGVFGEYYKRKEDRLVELAPRVSEVVGRDVGADSARWELCTRVFQVRSTALVRRLSIVFADGQCHAVYICRTRSTCCILSHLPHNVSPSSSIRTPH